MRISSVSSSLDLWRHIELAIRAIAFSLLLALAASPAWADRPSLRDLKWIHADADAIAAITRAPAECLAVPSNPDRARRVQLGRVAFRSPVLLGGVAARIGLSCDSCHRNGHDNPVFFVAGVSGDPGTADVTGSVFSTNRDDQRRNPVSIPSLVDAAAHPPFGTLVPAPDLPTFLHTAIVDEFMGRPPPPAVLEGITSYLGALRSSACPSPAITKITFDSDARALLETFDVVIAAVERHDSRTAEFALLALRAALGRVYERFPEALADRERLVELSMSLSRVRQRLEDGNGTELPRMLAAERAQLGEVIGVLRTKANESYYDPEVLRRVFDSDR